jgi:hypothetical protein
LEGYGFSRAVRRLSPRLSFRAKREPAVSLCKPVYRRHDLQTKFLRKTGSSEVNCEPMPEELAIAIVVLVIAGWILVKLFQLLAELLKALATALRGSCKALSDSVNEKIGQMFTWRKSKLAQHVHVFLPNELERAQHRVDLALSEFQRIQTTTSWVPQRPTWGKWEFARYVLPAKSDPSHEMNVEDIDSILHPERRTWAETESAILGHSCRYPCDPPRGTCIALIQAIGVESRLEVASFETEGLNKRANFPFLPTRTQSGRGLQRAAGCPSGAM